MDGRYSESPTSRTINISCLTPSPTNKRDLVIDNSEVCVILTIITYRKNLKINRIVINYPYLPDFYKIYKNFKNTMIRVTLALNKV